MKIDGDQVKGKAQGLFVDTDIIQFEFYHMPVPQPSDIVLINPLNTELNPICQ